MTARNRKALTIVGIFFVFGAWANLVSSTGAKVTDRESLTVRSQTLPSGREVQAVSPEEMERLRALGYIQ